MISLTDNLLIYSNKYKEIRRLPVEKLDSYLAIQSDNSIYRQIENKIIELSSYIISLSVSFLNNYYSIEELNDRFECLSDTLYMTEDNTYIQDDSVIETALKGAPYQKTGVLEDLYSKHDQQADKEFSDLDKRMMKWTR